MQSVVSACEALVYNANEEMTEKTACGRRNRVEDNAMPLESTTGSELLVSSEAETRRVPVSIPVDPGRDFLWKLREMILYPEIDGGAAGAEQ
jgi:hypothetical protein